MRLVLLSRLRAPVLGATIALVGLLGCGEPSAAPGPTAGVEEAEPLPPSVAALASPEERLAAILALGDEPGRLPLAAWTEAEEALRGYLPTVAKEGRSWRIVYTDLPAGDYLAFDLLDGEGDEAPRLAWFHLLFRPAPLSGDRFDGEPMRGFATDERPGRYLRVRLGDLELLAVPESEELRGRGLRELVGRFDLEGLARLGE